MHWLVGIDEAGYGPHLGPLVQAAAAIAVDQPDECLWTKHASAVRRAGDDDDGRIAIDDSKLVHNGPNRFERLESNLRRALNLDQPLDEVALGDSVPDLREEAWFESDSRICASHDAVPPFDVALWRTFVTPTPRFNRLVDDHDTKAAALSAGVIALMRTAVEKLPGDEPICFVIDKQGGRNFYAPMISAAFPDSWVHVRSEAASCSTYEIDGLQHPIRLVFRPKAESHCLPVALASMIAKYLRERFMQQFNAYWQKQVADLEPTAGYSTDARRFYLKIRPAMKRLGIAPELVWRKR